MGGNSLGQPSFTSHDQHPYSTQIPVEYPRKTRGKMKPLLTRRSRELTEILFESKFDENLHHNIANNYDHHHVVSSARRLTLYNESGAVNSQGYVALPIQTCVLPPTIANEVRGWTTPP